MSISRPENATHALGVILVIASALAFSLAGTLTKLIAADAWTISCWRGLIGGMLITAYVAWISKRDDSRTTFQLGWRGWVLATVGSAASLAFIFAFKMTYIANVAVIYATVPFMAAALAWWLVGEKFRRVVAGGLGSKGSAGDAVALLMTFGNALYMVLIRTFQDTPVVFAGAASALQLFVLGLFVAHPFAVSLEDAWLLVVFGASFAVAVILWTEGTKLIPASEAGLLGTAETPFAMILAWLVLSELPPLASFLGGAIVLTAVFAHSAHDLRNQNPSGDSWRRCSWTRD